ncbi:FHA domain-containing protein [Nannocystaceae bacterium ST9]
MPYTIEIRYTDRPGERRTFDQPIVIFGREQGDVALRDPLVSSRHAELRFDGHALYFRDLNSTNGSFDHSGARLSEPRPMAPQQGLRMGNSWIVLESIGAGAGATMFMPAMPAMAPPPGMAPTHASPAASRMVKLRLLDIRCVRQQEVGGDEPFLLVRKNKVWSHDNMKSGVTFSLRNIQPMGFADEIDVTLMEKDVGRDDRLGSGTITADQLGKGEQQFEWTEAGCHYQLIYEVVPA